MHIIYVKIWYIVHVHSEIKHKLQQSKYALILQVKLQIYQSETNALT